MLRFNFIERPTARTIWKRWFDKYGRAKVEVIEAREAVSNVKPILNDHTEIDPNKEHGYGEMFAGNVELAVERAKEDDIDKEARWPNHPGSRVYRIIEAIWEQER